MQRDKDFTGDRLTTFRQVFLRHGLPGLTLAIFCLAIPSLQVAYAAGLEIGAAHSLRYGLTGTVIFAGLVAYAWSLDRAWDPKKIGWVLYLGALSFWEEWVFRLALPQVFESWGASVILAAVISAAIFGAAHYFTLRWKWQWCFGAFLGGLALSRQMEVHQDLLLISAFHWIATYINTPRPPGTSGRANRST
ncbi:MAG: CPBP family intramembrane glutamic endopeptidase, partial [Pseudomonadota bacterium]